MKSKRFFNQSLPSTVYLNGTVCSWATAGELQNTSVELNHLPAMYVLSNLQIVPFLLFLKLAPRTETIVLPSRGPAQG